MVQEFHDIQQAVESLPDLALQYRQLERGALRFQVGWQKMGEVAATTAALDRLVEGHGGVEPGKVLLLLCRGGQDTRFDDVSISAGQAYVKAGGTPVGHQLIKPGYRATMLTLPTRILEAHLGGPLSAKLARGAVLDIAPRSRDAVLRSLEQARLTTEAQTRRFSETILRECCAGLGLWGSERTPGRPDEKAHLARAIRQRLHERPDMTFVDICGDLSISERTLRRVFSQVYTISPGQYHLTLRLNGVRQELRAQGLAAGTISQVAARHGFWHMGRFAAQYRRHFGETPSQTANRS